VDSGVSAAAEFVDGAWGITAEGEGDLVDDTYNACAEVAAVTTAAYYRERVPEGAERVELANSLRRCLATVGIEGMPFSADTRRANEILASAITFLGYEGGEPELLDDPRFGTVLDCLSQHDLLFPDRFAIGE
jgi:hypothetical protein